LPSALSTPQGYAEQQVLAFAVAEGGSRQIRLSGVLPGLELSLVEEALGRWSKTGPEGPSQSEDDTTLMRWLMETLA
jgi:hypothetical protein